MASAEKYASLVTTIQELSSARSLPEIMAVVQRAARALSGADGVTFVLREGKFCYYADEDAIGPLWKGKRFPLDACVSGWVMLHREPLAIEDIYDDPRVPQDAYRPTFVKSLAMVPIRSQDPLGAIGAYWAQKRKPTADELALLRALADSTAVALTNLELIQELQAAKRDLEARVEERTRELDAFASTAAHDLRAPLRAMRGFIGIFQEDYGAALDEEGARLLERVVSAAARMDALIEGLLAYARLAGEDIPLSAVELRPLVDGIVREMGVRVTIEGPLPAVRAHPLALRQAVENLLTNAFKFVAPGTSPLVRVRGEGAEGRARLWVEDNGIGIAADMKDKLFKPFSRLHPSGGPYPGVGVGLAVTRKAIERMGGRVGLESEPGRGSRFWIELPSA